MLINLLTWKYTEAWKGLPGNLDLNSTSRQINIFRVLSLDPLPFSAWLIIVFLLCVDGMESRKGQLCLCFLWPGGIPTRCPHEQRCQPWCLNSGLTSLTFIMVHTMNREHIAVLSFQVCFFQRLTTLTSHWGVVRLLTLNRDVSTKVHSHRGVVCLPQLKLLNFPYCQWHFYSVHTKNAAHVFMQKCAFYI